MPKFIICWGFRADVEKIEAESQHEALKVAVDHALRTGVLDDDIADTTWAEPYSDDLAYDLGLLEIPETRSFQEAAWRAERAPWR